MFSTLKLVIKYFEPKLIPEPYPLFDSFLIKLTFLSQILLISSIELSIEQLSTITMWFIIS